MEKSDEVSSQKNVTNLFQKIKENGFAKDIFQLKPFQVEVIGNLVIKNKHVFCVVPTGMGKTLCIRNVFFNCSIYWLSLLFNEWW